MIKFIFLMMFSAQLLAATIELTWDLPEFREDGTAIETIDRFNIYQTSDDGSQNVYEVGSTSTSYQIFNVEEGAYSFQISTLEAGQEGEKSDPLPVIVSPPTVSPPQKITISGNNLTIEVIE